MEGDLDLNPQIRADELEERLINFAVRIVKLSARLPRTPAGTHCGTNSEGWNGSSPQLR
jgi:hypothetical protein